MTPLKHFAQYISWLSIDVAIGAMAGMLFFEELLGASLHWPAYVLLGMAVWSIYTIDHLLDVRNKELPLSPRRAFHQSNWKPLTLVLSMTILIGMIGAFWWFGWGKELQLTLVLTGLICGSNLLIRKIGPGWMKELSIAVFYVVGIVWLPLLRSAGLDLVWQSVIFLPMYMGIAFLNLLMLSFLDQDEDRTVGFFSAALTLSPILLIQLIRRLAFGLIFISLAGFILLSSFYRPFACIILLMALIHYLTFFQKGLNTERKRMQMEVSFLLPLLLYFL
ncbi:hypothetical protein GCM10009119_28490 [Algoriphagus jejuensis]|uniref:UbiA prenyltransferase family protein n=1 Tax=Algoriphagus jejuensis TaxID=419934 RepID=A0ABP3YEK8_9BACT